MRNSKYKSHNARLNTVMSMDKGDSPSKIIVCLVCLLLALSSMTCDRYTNVSEGRYLTNGFSQYTDSMPVILACNETSSLFTKRSRLRVEQWFRPSMPFTLYSVIDISVSISTFLESPLAHMTNGIRNANAVSKVLRHRLI